MSTQKSYKQLRAELDEIMIWFESDDIDVEQALEKFAQAEKIIAELEKFLSDTELKIKKLK